MANYGKWIGGGLGWALGGPLGALFGYFVGSYFDGAADSKTAPRRRATQSGDFTLSLLVLIASVMRADGRIVKSELDYVRGYLKTNFGASIARQNMLMLRDIVKQSYSLTEICEQIRRYMDHPSRIQLIHLLFGVSRADGQVHPKEVELIRQIAGNLGISQKDYDSIRSMFIKESKGAYKILEISPKATDDEVKKAYRRMAVKYHPDKVSHLGEDFRIVAKEKFQKLGEAYDSIKKERGLK